MHYIPIEDYSFHALLIPNHSVKLVVRYKNWVLMSPAMLEPSLYLEFQKEVDNILPMNLFLLNNCDGHQLKNILCKNMSE
jgi:hypothetical protein